MSKAHLLDPEDRSESVIEHTMEGRTMTSWSWLNQSDLLSSVPATPNPSTSSARRSFDPLLPVRRWLNQIKIHDPKFAHSICRLVPAQCPFEREVKLFQRTILSIPPLCKLNPLYDEVVGLRFRALCYLADECGEDISQYC